MLKRVYAMMFSGQEIDRAMPITGKVRINLSLAEDLDDLADSLRTLDNKAAAIEGQIDEANRLIDELKNARALVNESNDIQKEASALQSAASPVIARYKSVSEELGLNPFDNENFVYLLDLQNGGQGTSLENIFFTSDTLSESLDNL